MRLGDLEFHRPPELEARSPPELRGLARDGVRLLVTDGDRTVHHRFLDLARILRRGDLLVVNRSATLAASLHARGPSGPLQVSLSTEYGRGIWLAEPRWSWDRPGPVGLRSGDELDLAGLRARVLASYPGIPRLLFLDVAGDLGARMRSVGEPIRYGYAAGPFPLAAYQTVFGSVPGSAEMPSAARPFTPALVRELERRGVRIASVLLHTGVSSLEVEGDSLDGVVFPEPFEVPERTVRLAEETRHRGGRIVAVGTSVVRALESARGPSGLRAVRGFSRLLVSPARPPEAIDGLLTGFHDPRTSHLALLQAVAGLDRVRASYRIAVDHRYLWHEFGDSHLLFRAG